MHETKLNFPIQHVWSFVSNMDRWAPLVPGYISHEIVNDELSTWSFTGDIGVIQKTIHLQVDIREWLEPTKITFDLTGINENVKGHGYFQASKIDWSQTKITGYVNMSAKGIMGPVVNPVLKSFIPKMTEQLTTAVAKKINLTEPATVSY